jgi:large-conductance mechanosensitive channel
MAFKEELIARSAVGIVIGLGINAFLTSVGQDILTPLLKQKSFDDVEKKFVVSIGGVRINYGDLIGHFISMVVIVGSVYGTLVVLEKRKIL